MAHVCSRCGTENREGVKFCKGCGRAIAEIEPKSVTDSDASERKCPTCGAGNGVAARFCKVCGTSLVEAQPTPAKVVPPPPPPPPPAPPPAQVPSSDVVAQKPGSAAKSSVKLFALAGLVVAIVGLGGWLTLGQKTQLEVKAVGATSGPSSLPPEPPPASLSQSAPLTTVAQSLPNETASSPVAEAPMGGSGDGSTSATITGQGTGPSEANLAAAERARQTQLRLQREERERIAALERQRAAQESAQQRAAQVQQRAEEAARKAAQIESQRAQVKQAAPPAGLTVDSVCASSPNIIRREICRIRECGKDAFFNDPICVRFRKAEEDNRQRQLDR